VCWQALPSHASTVQALPSSAHEVPAGCVGHAPVHVPAGQKVLRQSAPTAQASPSAQPGHVPPPQSTAVSLPSLTPLRHDGAAVVVDVVVTVVTDVVEVVGAHWQRSPQIAPPPQPDPPGGSQASPPDTTPSPH